MQVELSTVLNHFTLEIEEIGSHKGNHKATVEWRDNVKILIEEAIRNL
jgi:hypothetical protein